MTSIQSSQDFIRTLKAPSDPPSAGWPSKIEIARHAWDSNAFYLPSKAEVIVEWVLSTLLKEKNRPTSTSSIFSQEYWKLLLDVLSDKGSSNTRPLKAWLTPLLHRISLQPILLTFLTKYNEIDSYDDLSDKVSSCVAIMWPISVQKMTLEGLADLFGVLLQKADEGDLTLGIINIGMLVASSYHTSLGNSVNKKKFYQLFLQSSFLRWLRVVSQSDSPPINPSPENTRLQQNVYEAGTDSLFNLDILRQLSENHPTDQSTILFDRLRSACSSSDAYSVLLVLPRLFLSYVQAVKRHRGVVFSQSSNVGSAVALNDEVNAASMRFFANCEIVVGGGDDTAIKEAVVWNARLRLLEVVLDEKLFNIQQEDAIVVLNRIIVHAIELLSDSWKDVPDEHRTAISAAIRCLHKIAQIDCDLLLPFISRILPYLLPIPTADPAPSTLLDLILEYHIKTRTLNAHFINVLSSFTPTSFPTSTTIDSHGVYELCFSGHILSSRHLEKLGNAVRRFLTPGQTTRSVETLLQILKDSWETFLDAAEVKWDDNENPEKKKSKGDARNDNKMDVDGKSELQTCDADLLAVSFSLQAYLSLIIFSNLPIQNLTEDSANAVRSMISDFRKNVVRGALEKLLKMKRLSPGSGKKKRRRDSSGGQDGWGMQIVATAVLRIFYALCIVRYLDLIEDEGKVVEQAREIVAKESGKGNLIAELELEIFRILLYHVSAHETRQGEALEIISSALSYLNGSFSSNVTWSGLPCQLKAPESGALALLHLILVRWLPLVDHLASPAVLTGFIQLILNINLDPVQNTADSALRSDHLLLRLLHSAEFWEMHNFRSAFLSYLVQITSVSDFHLQGAALPVYRLLLYVPAEYLTKDARLHFIKGAYTADIQLVKDLSGKGKEQAMGQWKSVLRNLITLRVFLKRVIGLVGFERASNQDVDLGSFIVHLMSFDRRAEGSEHDVFVQSTLDLIELCFKELLKNSSSHPNSLLKVLTSFTQCPVFTSVKDDPPSLQSQAIAVLSSEVTKLDNASSLPRDCVTSLRSFHEQLSKTLSQQLQNVSQSQLVHLQEALAGWCCILRLRKWLGDCKSEGNNTFGRRFVALVVRTQESENDERLDNIRVSVLAILRAELALLLDPAERKKQLDLIVATFIVFYGASNTARTQLDEHIASVSKTLTPDDYSHALGLLAESLSSRSLATEKLEHTLHLSILLLKEHPQHTLKHMQAFVTECLNTLAGSRELTTCAISLRLLTLEFVVQHCSERPAVLRPIDLGSIWTILFRFLEPSEDHDDATTPEIFHKIVASISALVRLRRDLLTPVLPHLGLVLRRLLLSMRSCRPQLGSKQTALVMRTQPRWINAKQPLGSEESRMLSRLLETLNVKTIIRSHTTTEVQKAESLGKPFSKHAAYVLAAYIEALNDPLCMLNLEMRRELEPGLFTLCGLMGEHARDALVVGLDASGKAALKLVWKEYEKQRYVGEG